MSGQSNQRYPVAPELDEQIENGRCVCYDKAQTLADLTHRKEIWGIDSFSQKIREAKGLDNSDENLRRSDDDILIREVIWFAHYLQYKAPLFMDAWINLAKKAKEGCLIKAQQELEASTRVLPVVLEKIGTSNAGSKEFMQGAYLLMAQDNQIGEATRELFRVAKNGEEFKAGLLELIQGDVP